MYIHALPFVMRSIYLLRTREAVLQYKIGRCFEFVILYAEENAAFTKVGGYRTRTYYCSISRKSYRCCNFNQLSLCATLQVYGWDIFGTVTFNDVNCSGNVAANEGGCFYGAGSNIFNDGVVMLDNEAENGGCICECNMHRFGFLCTGTVTAATTVVLF